MNTTEILTTYNIDTDNQNENNFSGLYNILIEYEIANENELELVCSINGNNVDTLLSVLYCRTGLRSIEQLLSEITDANK